MTYVVKLAAAKGHAATRVATHDAKSDTAAYLIGCRLLGYGGELVVVVLALGTMRLCFDWLFLALNDWVPFEFLSL